MARLMEGKALRSRSIALASLAAAASAMVWTTGANAVSLRVKLACSRDYYALCSQFASDSAETRQCMRAAGSKLSSRCINALVEEGEVSVTEVSRRSVQLRQ